MQRCFAILIGFAIFASLAFGNERDDFEHFASRALVEGRADLSTWEFRGLEYFSPEEVRAMLSDDLGVLAATRPTGSLLKLINEAERAICDAFAQSGYCDSQASFSLSETSGSVVVKVESGPRYVAGEIRILDAPPKAEAAIREWLTSEPTSISPRRHLYFRRGGHWLSNQHPPSNEKDAASWRLAEGLPWQTSEPARCSVGQIDRIRDGVADMLALQGYPLATFEVRIEPVGQSRADLVIDLSDPGPRATLGSVDIEGLERHHYPEVFDYLGLTGSEEFDLDQIVDAYDRLSTSTQFWQHEMRVRFPSPGAGAFGMLTMEAPAKLEIKLTEFRHSAKLHEPPLDAHQVLQRAGKWADDFLEQEEWDLHVQHDYPLGDEHLISTDAIVRPQHGWIVSSKLVHAQNPRIALRQFTLANTKYMAGATDLQGTTRWSLPQSFPMVPAIRCFPAEAEGKTYFSTVRTNLWFYEDKQTRPLVRLHLDSRVALNEAHRQGARFEFDNGVLVVSQLNARMQFDAETGRLLEYKGWSDDGVAFHITTAKLRSRFEQRVATFESLPNKCMPGDELGSLIRWSLDVCAQLPMDRPLVSPTTSDWIKEFTRTATFAAWNKKHGLLQFAISNNSWSFHSESPCADEKYRESGSFAGIARKADELFIRETWPWTFAQEFGIYWSIRDPGDYDHYPLWTEIYRAARRDDSGPVLAWMILSIFEVPPKDTVNWGLRKLDDDSFSREVAMLTTPDTGMMKLLAAVVPVVQSLPEEDTDWLCGLAGDETAPKLEEVTRLLRKLDASSDDALQASLRALLEGEIRERVEADLRAAASAAE